MEKQNEGNVEREKVLLDHKFDNEWGVQDLKVTRQDGSFFMNVSYSFYGGVLDSEIRKYHSLDSRDGSSYCIVDISKQYAKQYPSPWGRIKRNPNSVEALCKSTPKDAESILISEMNRYLTRIYDNSEYQNHSVHNLSKLNGDNLDESIKDLEYNLDNRNYESSKGKARHEEWLQSMKDNKVNRVFIEGYLNEDK